MMCTPRKIGRDPTPKSKLRSQDCAGDFQYGSPNEFRSIGLFTKANVALFFIRKFRSKEPVKEICINGARWLCQPFNGHVIHWAEKVLWTADQGTWQIAGRNCFR
jgi:hypothetical protein